MHVTIMCPCCGRKMRAPSQARGRMVRCVACDEPFGVAHRPWYYQVLGMCAGPVCPSILLTLARAGEIGPETLVRKGEGGRWVPAARICGLFAGNAARPAVVPQDCTSVAVPTPWTDVA